jgi:iron complex outermembrane receptor protein
MQKKTLKNAIGFTVKMLAIQMVLSLVFTIVAFSKEVKSQDILEKVVSINLKNEALKNIIKVIETKTAVSFVYSSTAIETNRKLSVKADASQLGIILSELLSPISISFKVVNNQIILFSTTDLANKLPLFTGTVTNIKTGETLGGATIKVKGKNKSTTSNSNGTFTLDVSAGDVLIISFIGFDTKEVKVDADFNVAIKLNPSTTTIEEITVIGSRGRPRTDVDRPVPVDVLNLNDLAKAAPQANLTQILNYVAPSFTSNTATVADGTDHIDPAQLRGLGPDQVLVLLNGKRRHSSSLVNVNGTPGRGSVGTDLNAIPAFSIDRIEVLRDGASAQYGSDAIAGVINVVMKKNIKKFTASVYTGANVSMGANDHRGGLDGGIVQVDANYGIGIGKKGGVINFTGSLVTRQDTRRATDFNGTLFNIYNAIENRSLKGGTNLSSLFGNITNTPNTNQIISTIKQYAPQVAYLTAAQQSNIQNATTIAGLQGILGANVTNDELAYRGLERRDFNMRIGQSSLQSGQIFINSQIPISTNSTFYSFGGFGVRKGNSAGFYRRPNQNRTSTQIYPNGFLPEISSDITDASIAVGVRGKHNGWNYDVSNTLGNNQFLYTIKNTANATQGIASATSFNAGKLGFTQNTTNLDISKGYDVLEGLNLAFGAEYRVENFNIKAGDQNSYERFDINGAAATPTTAGNLLPTDFFGSGRPGGAQVFPGFRPENALSKNRNNVATYVDVELNPTKSWLINGALRYENYSDFGSTLNYKLATRIKLAKGLNFRAAIATGFRAPSLQQRFFNSTATQFLGGVPFEVGTFTNESKAAQLLGIPTLKQEDSYSYSAGFTYKVPATNLTFTVDGYFVKIKNRIILTGQFARPSGTVTGDQLTLQQLFDQANATSATFFTNAINTESKGIDFIISNKFKLDGASLKTDLAGTVSQTNRRGDIQASNILKSTGNLNNYFNEASRVFLESAVPRTKLALMNTLTTGKFEIFMRQTYFGRTEDPNTADVNGDGIVNGATINDRFIAVEHPFWEARTITDFSVGYELNQKLRITVGANNVFDIYPDKNIKTQSALLPLASGGYATTPSTSDLSNNNQFEYSRNVSQFGFNGRFIFARLNISIN